MPIEIPETVQRYCENENNGKAIDLLLGSKIMGKTLEEMAQYNKAKLFCEHFLYDMWNFRYQIFQEVWLPLLKEIKEYECSCDIEDVDYNFVVKCNISDSQYYLGISMLSGKNAQLYMVASRISEEETEEKLGEEKQFKYMGVELFNEKFDDCDESCTYGCTISLKDKTEITDDEIAKFKTDAENMMKFIYNKDD